MNNENLAELKSLSNENLVEEFEKTVCWWHYDLGNEKPKFDLDSLREEVLERMK